MIALLRHGQTIGNVSKANYIGIDEAEMKLTSQGIKEIQALAGILQESGLCIGRTVVAPELRCRYSAQLLQLPQDRTTVDDRIRAQSWGTLDFPGAQEILSRAKSWPSGLDVRFPGGETAREVFERCRPVADGLRVQALIEQGKVQAVVTHGVVIKMLLGHWFGWSEDQIETTASIKTGAGLLVTFKPDADPEVGQLSQVIEAR